MSARRDSLPGVQLTTGLFGEERLPRMARRCMEALPLEHSNIDIAEAADIFPSTCDRTTT